MHDGHRARGHRALSDENGWVNSIYRIVFLMKERCYERKGVVPPAIAKSGHLEIKTRAEPDRLNATVGIIDNLMHMCDGS